MIMVNLKRFKGNVKYHNLGSWELYFTKKPLHIKQNGVKYKCVAYVDNDEQVIKVNTQQSLQEIKNSLRHEFLHIAEWYRRNRTNIDDEEFVSLQERLISYADEIVDQWLGSEI